MSPSTSTIIRVAFLLTLGFILPQNVLSTNKLFAMKDIPVIKSICHKCDGKSVTFYAASTESWTLSHTGRSVEVISHPTTNGTVTGGVFGSDLYKFHKFQYDWETCGNNITFEIRSFYFNTKYESFENSLNYPDGLIQVYVPVYANGDIDNPLFEKFERPIRKIKKPGDRAPVPSEDSFSWFKNFPTQTSYNYFRSSYFDIDDGKIYPCATTVDLPKEKRSNFMSRKQFQNTFGKLVDDLGNPLNNLRPPKDEPKSDVKKAKGIKVVSI